jgi:predicted Ser/Thr protein kinase
MINRNSDLSLKFSDILDQEVKAVDFSNSSTNDIYLFKDKWDNSHKVIRHVRCNTNNIHKKKEIKIIKKLATHEISPKLYKSGSLDKRVYTIVDFYEGSTYNPQIKPSMEQVYDLLHQAVKITQCKIKSKGKAQFLNLTPKTKENLLTDCRYFEDRINFTDLHSNFKHQSVKKMWIKRAHKILEIEKDFYQYLEQNIYSLNVSIIHHDLKRENLILLDSGNKFKIIDWDSICYGMPEYMFGRILSTLRLDFDIILECVDFLSTQNVNFDPKVLIYFYLFYYNIEFLMDYLHLLHDKQEFIYHYNQHEGLDFSF